jgi:hypothetical protein
MFLNPHQRRRGQKIKNIAFFLGSIMLSSGTPLKSNAMAKNTFRIFNVDVFVDHQPQCPLGPAILIKASAVSPFQEEVDLGDLIAELARKGAEAGEKLIYGIKLTSFVPNQGASATALASHCVGAGFGVDTGFLPFPKNLLDALFQGTAVRGFSFYDIAPGASRSVTTSNPSQRPLKDASSLDKLRNLILSPTMYELTPGLRKSCPFIPSFGFEIESQASAVWWLISEACQTAALVAPDTDWRRTDVLNLRSEAIQQFRALFASEGSK